MRWVALGGIVMNNALMDFTAFFANVNANVMLTFAIQLEGVQHVSKQPTIRPLNVNRFSCRIHARQIGDKILLINKGCLLSLSS